MGVPPNGWFMREHPIKMDDLGVSPFMETPIPETPFLVKYTIALVHMLACSLPSTGYGWSRSRCPAQKNMGESSLNGGFLSHRGIPQSSSISRWDFPWNKPTITWGAPIPGNPQIGKTINCHLGLPESIPLPKGLCPQNFWPISGTRMDSGHLAVTWRSGEVVTLQIPMGKCHHFPFEKGMSSGWWFGCHQFLFPIHIGFRLSSQLTKSYFSEG